MKFCVTTLATQGVISPEELMPELHAWGYDGIELWSGDLSGEAYVGWYRRDEPRIAELWPAEELTKHEEQRLQSLRCLANANGLAIPMISPYFNFVGGRQRWEESLAVGRRYLEYAERLSCPLIRTCTGQVASSELTEADWRAIISGLRALTSLPGAENVTFALECHRNRPEDTIASVLLEIAEVGAPNLRVLLQPSSLVSQVDIHQMLDALWEYTVHVHANLTYDQIDWAWLASELERRGFEGFFSLERVAEPALETIEQTVRGLKKASGVATWG